VSATSHGSLRGEDAQAGAQGGATHQVLPLLEAANAAAGAAEAAAWLSNLFAIGSEEKLVVLHRWLIW
jgi:hypothetical protein